MIEKSLLLHGITDRFSFADRAGKFLGAITRHEILDIMVTEVEWEGAAETGTPASANRVRRQLLGDTALWR